MIQQALGKRGGGDQSERSVHAQGGEQSGMALVVALIALSVLSLIGLYMTFNASTATRISDNYESRIRASFAAQAGLNHAREVLRGLRLTDQLGGPIGPASRTASYLAQARLFPFRTPLNWSLGRSLNVADPTGDVAGLSQEGILNAGPLNGNPGTILIPMTGIATSIPNPNGTGTIVVGRYFVKITDNNGEPSELLGDPADDPFKDGDGVVIVRSMGVATAIREDSAGTVRRNSVVIYESRMKKSSTFKLDAPLIVEGNQVQSSSSNMFAGNAFSIDGGASCLGIATIDTDTSDSTHPTDQISSQVAHNQQDNITGIGTHPSIGDITAAVIADPNKSFLRDKNYLWNFVHTLIPVYADNHYEGDQSWHGGNAPDLGTLSLTLPYNDPAQHPKITYVNGDLDISGNLSGGGILVVTGKLKGSGHLSFNGLILVIGTGNVDGAGLNIGFNGGMFIVNITQSGGNLVWGTPKFSWKGNSNIKMNSDAISMALDLLPLSQLGWREITSIIDP